MKTFLRNKLSEVKMVIIDEFSMVSSDLFLKIDDRLLEIFMFSTSIEFAGLTVALVADLLQLPPVMGKPVYATADGCDSLERHLSLNLWRMLQFAELTEVMRQRGDTKFIDLLNKIRVGNVDENAQKLIRERFIEESDTNYRENALHVFAKNYATVKHNRKMLDKFPDKMYNPADCKYLETLISLSQNKK